MPLTYSRIEEQLTDALPEIRPAAERYWRDEGAEGQDSGAYIFIEDLFAKYVHMLLAIDPSTSRDHLLRRAFDFIEEMMASQDDEIVNLATVGIFEGRAAWWWVRAAPFLGNRTTAVLDQFQAEWRSHAASGERPPESERCDVIDLYGIREVIG
jgi:hypothetical protein